MTEIRKYSNSVSKNPTVRRNLGDVGCRELDSCEVVFVKYGGDALRDNFIPSITIL